MGRFSDEEHRGHFPANRLCDVVGVSTRGLRAFRSRPPASRRQQSDLVTLAHKRALGAALKRDWSTVQRPTCRKQTRIPYSQEWYEMLYSRYTSDRPRGEGERGGCNAIAHWPFLARAFFGASHIRAIKGTGRRPAPDAGGDVLGEYAVSGPELKKMIKLARKQPMPFAFNPGKSEEEHYLGMHRKRSVQVLVQEAKSVGPGPKVAFGMAEVDRKLLRLTCERVLPMLAKRVKKYLKYNKVALNVEIMDADGNILESDIEEGLPDDPSLFEDEDAPSAEATKTSEQTQDAKALARKLVEMRNQGAALPTPQRDKVGRALSQLADWLKAGELGKVNAGLGSVSKLLASLPSTPSQEQGHEREQTPRQEQASDVGIDTDRLRETIKGLLSTLPGDIQTLAKANPDTAAKLAAAMGHAKTLIQKGDLPKALDLLMRCADGLATAQKAARTAEAQEVVPEGLVAQRVHDIELLHSQWQVSRMRSVDGLGALVDRLAREEDPDLLDIAVKVGVLARDVPEGLERALLELARFVAAGDSSKSDAAKAKISGEVAAAAKYLKAHLADLKKCEDNPFGIKVDIITGLSKALKSIQASVAKM